MLTYSQVTFEILRDELKINLQQQPFIPDDLPTRPLPEWLTAYRQVSAASATVGKSEKAISEALIAPVLYALSQANADRISVFSGEPLYTTDLGGVCDFIIAARPHAYLPDPPIVILVEAKKLDLLNGIPQCIAEMHTAQRLNQQAGRSGAVFGCVTIGTEWLFIRLENDRAHTHPTVYFSSQLPQVLAVFQWMIDQFD